MAEVIELVRLTHRMVRLLESAQEEYAPNSPVHAKIRDVLAEWHAFCDAACAHGGRHPDRAP